MGALTGLSGLSGHSGLFGVGSGASTVRTARAYNSVNIVGTGDTFSPLTLDSERWDTTSLHDPSTNNDRLIAPLAGYYLIIGQARWNYGGPLRYEINLEVNDTDVIARVEGCPESTSGHYLSQIVSTIYYLNVLDYVNCKFYNNVDPTTILKFGNASPEVMMYRLGNLGARVTNSVASVPALGWSAVTFDTELWDTDGIHSTSTNTDRLVCQTPGYYLIIGNTEFYQLAGGRRIIAIKYNDLIWLAEHEYAAVADNNTFPQQIVATIYYMNAGDYVNLQVYQYSAGAITLMKDAIMSPQFMMHRIA